MIELLDQLPGFGGGDVADGRGAVMLESDQPGDQGGQHHGHQDIGDFRIDRFEPVHDAECQGPHEQGRPVGIVKSRLQDMPDGFVVMRCGIHIDAEHFGQLRGCDDDGGSVGESVDHRMGEKIDHQAEPQHAQGQLKKSHHEGQYDRIGDVARTAGRGQGFQ